MGRIVVTEFVSLDGVIEDPGGSEDFKYGGWSFEIDRGEEGDKFKLDEALEADALLLGRRTYEGFAAAWPSRDGEFADKFNNMPKYVVSSTLKDPEWSNSTVLEGDLAEEVSKLRQEVDGDIVVHGSAQLVQALVENGLVDELRLMVFPVVLGAGKRLFGETSDKQRAAALRLEDRRRRRADPDLRAGRDRGRLRPALEGELGDCLRQELGHVRHRDVPGTADIAQLGARDEPLEAASLPRQQDHVHVAPEDQHGDIKRRQPARLGRGAVRERGVEPWAGGVQLDGLDRGGPGRSAMAAPLRAGKHAAGERGCGGAPQARSRVRQASASRAGSRRPTPSRARAQARRARWR